MRKFLCKIKIKKKISNKKMFLSLLSVRYKGKATSYQPFVYHKSFGFHENGFYNVTISDVNVSKLFVGLMSTSEYQSFNDTIVVEDDHCNESIDSFSSISTLFDFENSAENSLTFAGTITKEDVYYLYYYSCTGQAFSFNYQIHFGNPNGGLDYRSEPLLYTTPAFLGIITILFVVWILNWLLNFKVQIYIHYCFTATFFFTFLNSVADLIDVQTQNVEGNTTISFIFYFVTLIIKYIFLLSTMLLCAKGWCIIVDTIKVSELFLSVIYSGITIGTIFILYFSYVPNSIFVLIIVILACISFGLYFYKLLKSISDVNMQIFAHMLTIRNAGIDPNTTPLKKKKDMYNQFYYAFFLFCILVCVQLFMSSFPSTSYWIQPFVWQLSDTTILLILGYIFRIRDVEAGGYYAITGTNDDVEEIALADLERLEHENGGMEGGVEWKPGMPLPSRPNIVMKPQSVTIESPEGIEEVLVNNAEINPTEA